MGKFMNFDAHVQSVFENDENKFNGFMELLNDATVGMGEVEGFTKKEVNDKIVSCFRSLIGCDEKSDAKTVRRAIRRNKDLVFDLLEEVVDNLLVSGWQNDPFMMKFLDQKNLALGDKNEFYTEDDSMISVMKVSGNHHDIFLTISVRTK